MSSFCPNCNIQYDGAEDFCGACGGPLLANAAAPVAPEAPVNETTPANSLESATSAADEAVPHAQSTSNANAATTRALIKAKLDRFIRSATAKADAVEEAVTEDGQAPAAGRADSVKDLLQEVLPPHEKEQGWRIQGGLFNSPKGYGYEQWPVAKSTASGEVRAIFRRFTPGALTTRQTYEAVLNAVASAQGTMAKLYSYGTVQMGGGARADYEIVALPVGQPLHVWLHEKGTAGVDPARYLAPLLASLLKRMQNMGVRPITLHPRMLWIDATNHVITLGVLGALALRGEGDNFCADLANSALLTLPYAAPELLGRRLIAVTTETFAAGQILSEALFGEARDHTFIQDGSVPFASIDDDVLRTVLMGLLWPYPDGRWSADQFATALVPGAAEFPKCPPWQSLRPGAAKAAFPLKGEDFFLPEDLLDAAVEHWDEALLRCDEILKWLKSTRFKGQAGLLRQAKLDGRSADWVLLRLRRLVLPDAPMKWREHSLEDADAEYSLIQLAQRALAEGEDAKQAQADLEKLFNADLRGAFTVNVIGKENNP